MEELYILVTNSAKGTRHYMKKFYVDIKNSRYWIIEDLPSYSAGKLVVLRLPRRTE
jgi:hypothetical protein